MVGSAARAPPHPPPDTPARPPTRPLPPRRRLAVFRELLSCTSSAAARQNEMLVAAIQLQTLQAIQVRGGGGPGCAAAAALLPCAPALQRAQLGVDAPPPRRLPALTPAFFPLCPNTGGPRARLLQPIPGDGGRQRRAAAAAARLGQHAGRRRERAARRRAAHLRGRRAAPARRRGQQPAAGECVWGGVGGRGGLGARPGSCVWGAAGQGRRQRSLPRCWGRWRWWWGWRGWQSAELLGGACAAHQPSPGFTSRPPPARQQPPAGSLCPRSAPLPRSRWSCAAWRWC
jgi:hypothetical protein